MSNAYALVAVMALVTYLIRMLPLAVFRRQIRSRFARSFLHYVPCAVLSAMTIPAIFSSTASPASAAAGFAAALAAALKGRSMLTVATLACATAYLAQLVIDLLA